RRGWRNPAGAVLRLRLGAAVEDRKSIWSSSMASRSWGRARHPSKLGYRRAHSRRMTTSNKDNKDIVKEFIDRLFTDGDVSVLDELAAPNYVDHDPPF